MENDIGGLEKVTSKCGPVWMYVKFQRYKLGTSF